MLYPGVPDFTTVVGGGQSLETAAPQWLDGGRWLGFCTPHSLGTLGCPGFLEGRDNFLMAVAAVLYLGGLNKDKSGKASRETRSFL